MKLIFLLLIFINCSLIQSIDEEIIDDDKLELIGFPKININLLVDPILAKISYEMMQKELDPATLPDIEEKFVIKDPLHVKHQSTVKLKDGWVQDISKVLRDGDAYGSTYPKSITTLVGRATIPMYLRSVQFGSKFKINVGMLARCSGEVLGTVSDIEMFLDAEIVGMGKKNHKYVLNCFNITNMGEISIRFINNPLEDWIMNPMSELITNIMHDEIVQIVNSTANIVGKYIVDHYLN